MPNSAVVRRRPGTTRPALFLYEHIIFWTPRAANATVALNPRLQTKPKGNAMARKLTKSNAHFQRAVKRLPLGVASNFRYWGEDRTIYVKSGVGARITDLDGNVYVDYRMGYGAAIL